MNQIINLANRNQIIRIGSDFEKLNGIAIVETPEGQFVSHPIVSDGWQVKTDVTNFDRQVIGKKGDRIHITNGQLQEAFQHDADSNNFLIGNQLKQLKRLGITIGREDVNLQTKVCIYPDCDEDGIFILSGVILDYYYEGRYPYPHFDQLPIPEFFFSFTREIGGDSKTAEGKPLYDLTQIKSLLYRLLISYIDYFGTRNIRLVPELDVSTSDTPAPDQLTKAQVQQLKDMLTDLNKDLAKYENRMFED